MSGVEAGDAGVVVNGVRVRVTTSICNPEYDCVVLLRDADKVGSTVPAELAAAVEAYEALDAGARSEPCVVSCGVAGGGRIVVAPLGSISPYDDVRSAGEAAARGLQRALRTGAKKPLLALPAAPLARWERAPLVALLAALETLYVPLQLRESYPTAATPRAIILGVYIDGTKEEAAQLVRAAAALEQARALARDVGGADPERMTPMAAAKYITAALSGAPQVTVRLLDDRETILHEYPLFAAVSRAADAVPRHKGCIAFLEYVPSSYNTTVYLVGKGVTYDTGGADVKTGGAMAGMSYDKCGAAACAGFVHAAAALGARVRVIALLALVRNSIGEESYVADEVIASRSGLPVLIGNTDAEGRMAMADLLEQAAREAERERAAGRTAHVYSIATLTGHAARAVGPYTALVDNAAAHAAGHATQLAACGDAVGEGAEVSRLRREDVAAHSWCGAARFVPGALLQAKPGPSTTVARGHQGPAAFLAAVANLTASTAPPYTHLDIAGSAGDHPASPTAVPLLTLAAYYKLI